MDVFVLFLSYSAVDAVDGMPSPWRQWWLSPMYDNSSHKASSEGCVCVK